MEYEIWSATPAIAQSSSEEAHCFDNELIPSLNLSLTSSAESFLSTSLDESFTDNSPTTYSLRDSSHRLGRNSPGRSRSRSRAVKPHEEELLGTSTGSDRSSFSGFESTLDRSEEFVGNSRVYHALFGTGVVLSNDGTYLSIRFDDHRYGDMKLKSFYAVPKMVLIPYEH